MEEIKKTNNRNFEVRHLKIALDTQDRVMSDYIIKELEITFKENMHIELNIELAVKKLVCSHFTDTFSCQLNPVRRMYIIEAPEGTFQW